MSKIKIIDSNPTLNDRKQTLKKILIENNVNLTGIKIIYGGLLVFLTDDKQGEKLMLQECRANLLTADFDIANSPELDAKKSVIIKQLDDEIYNANISELIVNLESNNAVVCNNVYKLPVRGMMKIRFTDISMVTLACERGLLAFGYSITKYQIEQERFNRIIPCWTCYKYTHKRNRCPTPNICICSECAELGHTFKSCTNTFKKCINCNEPHRTLASKCKVRKQLIRELENVNNKNKQSGTQDIQLAVKQAVQNTLKDPLNLPNQNKMQISTNTEAVGTLCFIYGHLKSLYCPEKFEDFTNIALSANNLPNIHIPDNNGLNPLNLEINPSLRNTSMKMPENVPHLWAALGDLEHESSIESRSQTQDQTDLESVTPSELAREPSTKPKRPLWQFLENLEQRNLIDTQTQSQDQTDLESLPPLEPTKKPSTKPKRPRSSPHPDKLKSKKYKATLSAYHEPHQYTISAPPSSPASSVTSDNTKFEIYQNQATALEREPHYTTNRDPQQENLQTGYNQNIEDNITLFTATTFQKLTPSDIPQLIKRKKIKYQVRTTELFTNKTHQLIMENKVNLGKCSIIKINAVDFNQLRNGGILPTNYNALDPRGQLEF